MSGFGPSWSRHDDRAEQSPVRHRFNLVYVVGNGQAPTGHGDIEGVAHHCSSGQMASLRRPSDAATPMGQERQSRCRTPSHEHGGCEDVVGVEDVNPQPFTRFAP